MNDLSPEARRTLAQAKSGQPRASSALRTRVKENVLRAVAAAPAASLDDEPPLGAAPTASESTFAKLPVWALPSLGALVVIGGLAMLATQRTAVRPSTVPPTAAQRERTTPSAAAHEARSLDTLPPRVEDRVLPEGPDSDENGPRATQRTRSIKAPAREHARAVTQSSDERQDKSARVQDADLRAEMQLLARAEAALRASEPLSALSILDEQARELRSGQLQGERDGLRLIAQCTLGRDPQSALARYLREHRDGVLQGRIRASCARFLP